MRKILDPFIFVIMNKQRYSFIFLMLSFLILIPGIQDITFDPSYRAWMSAENPILQSIDELEEKFGSDDTLIIGVRRKKGTFFNSKSIDLLNTLTEQLWTLPNVVRVDSLSNFNWVHSFESGDLKIEPLLPRNLTEAQIVHRKSIIDGLHFLKKFLINEDLNFTILIAHLKPGFKKPIAPIATFDKLISLEKKIEPNIRQQYDFYYNGNASWAVFFEKIAISDATFLFPLTLILLVVFSFLIFQTVLSVISIFSVMTTTLFFTFSIIGHLGISLNNLSLMSINIIMAISIADTIHIINSFYQFRETNNNYDATKLAFEKNFFPTLLTSIATAIGFAGLTLTDLQGIAVLGKTAAIGSLLAWFSTFLILRFILVRAKKNPSATNIFQKLMSNCTVTFYLLTKSHRTLLYIFSFISILFFVTVSLSGNINSNGVKFFPKDHMLTTSLNAFSKYFGGITTIEVIVDSGKKEGVKDPHFLKKLEVYENMIKKDSNITATNSIVSIIKQINQALNNDNKFYYSLPTDPNLIAQEILLYTFGLPANMGIEDRISIDGRYARLSTFTHNLDTKDYLELHQKMKDIANTIELKIKLTGKGVFFHNATSDIISLFFRSIFTASILITLLIFLYLKSAKFTVISLIPNLVPLTFSTALTIFLYNTYDFGTVLVVSVLFGIIVDDSIHLIVNYSDQIKQLQANPSFEQREEVMLDVLRKTGSSLVATSIIIVIGFGISVLGDYQLNARFGVVVVLVTIFALVCDLTLLPHLLIGKRKTGSR
ncbi:MMPL family transporter [Bacteriovoracaceae bacterium]|nr:MMPL family transporter [Bacteriovoracaceae bacterium]